MSRKRKILVLALVGGILAMQLGFTVALMKPDGIRVHWPDSKVASERTFDVTGDAWMAPGRGSIAAIEVLATPADRALSPAEREAGAVLAEGALTWVEDRGKPLYPLQFWTAPIELPAAGEWDLVATARDAAGREIRSKTRRFTVDEVPPRAFVAWSGQHLIAIGVAAAVIAAFGLAAAKGASASCIASPPGTPSSSSRRSSPSRPTGSPGTRGARAPRSCCTCAGSRYSCSRPS